MFDRMEKLDRDIGARVRARRREMRMSQSDLGKRLGVTFQQVQKYERGMNRLSASSLVLVAEALQCRPIDLLGQEGGSGDEIDWSRLQSNDVLAAVESFSSIKSATVRRTVLDLMRSLGEGPG